MDSKCLESFLIPEYEIATEETTVKSGLFDTAATILIIAGYVIYKRYKEKKMKQEESKKIDDLNNAQKAKLEATKKALYEKYNLNDPKAKEKFKDDLIKDIDKRIKSMVNNANRNKKYIEDLKRKVSNRYGEDDELVDLIKPGYFTAKHVKDNPDFW